MAELGAVSSYLLSMQQLQIALVKNSIQMQQQAVDILLNNDSTARVAPSENLGHNVDISI